MKINNHKKEMILSVLGVLLLIGAVISTSLAVFVFTATGTTENTITAGSISFSYNDEKPTISITNLQPMTDAAGKTLLANDTINGIVQGYFDFTVTGNITGNLPLTYEVYSTLDSSSTMDTSYVKVYLTDGSGEKALSGYDGAVVPTYASLPQADSDASGKRLYTDSFSTGDLNQSFRLRIWVADTYTTADLFKTFSMRVNVKATS